MNNNNNVMDTIFMNGKLIKITEEMDLDNVFIKNC
jgi:hypothetical protein